MLSSSSVNPEHGEVTAAELLAVNAAKQTRATGAEGFASFLRTQDEVDALCEKYGVPKEFTARPAGDLCANSTPPPGAICVYARALEAGMRVPLHGFFREVLAHFGIAPAQLTPNGWRFMAGFLVLCQSASVPPSLAVFLRFFFLSIIDQKHEKGWYFFRSRRGGSSLRFTEMPKVGWRHDFFFLSSPEPWHCAVEWGEPSKSSSRNPALTVEENKSMVKLLSVHGGATVDLRNLLPGTCSRRRRRRGNSNLAAAMISTASPPPPPSSTRITPCSKGMDPYVYDMMKTMLAEKAGAQATASVKKRTWEEANGEEEVLPLSVLSSVRSPPPQHFPSRLDGHTTDWEAARELLQDTVAPPVERAFAAKERSDDAAIRQTANHVLELEGKLVASERDAAALREQLEEAKNDLASAKRAADAEQEEARSELAAGGAELEKTKAELAAVEAEVVKTKAELSAVEAEVVKTNAELSALEAEVVKTKAELYASLAEAELAAAKQAAEAVKTKAELAAAREEAVKTKAELAAALAEAVKTKAELAAAKRAAETELMKAKAKLTTVEAELESAKAAAVQQILASEEQVRQRAEDALEGYKRWRGRHAPAGRAA